MDRIRMKFIIAVTNRLAQAAESNAKTDLIEELSENLYQRYLDLTAAGLGEEEAYTRALEDLGDVGELLEYLSSVGPEGELPGQDTVDGKSFSEFADELGRNLEDIIRETVSQTRDAVDQAKIIVRDVTKKLREKYPHGFEGHIHLHFDDEADEHAGDEDCGSAGEEGKTSRDKVYGIGYDRKKGGFFAQWGEGRGRCVEGTSFPARDLKAVDVQVTNGDVTFHLLEDPEADVMVDGDVEQLELRVSEDGVLSIRQGKTVSSSFFFGRGLCIGRLFFLRLRSRNSSRRDCGCIRFTLGRGRFLGGLSLCIFYARGYGFLFDRRRTFAHLRSSSFILFDCRAKLFLRVFLSL